MIRWDDEESAKKYVNDMVDRMTKRGYPPEFKSTDGTTVPDVNIIMGPMQWGNTKDRAESIVKALRQAYTSSAAQEELMTILISELNHRSI